MTQGAQIKSFFSIDRLSVSDGDVEQVTAPRVLLAKRLKVAGVAAADGRYSAPPPGGNLIEATQTDVC
jgi:hypothetical protein